MAKFADFLTTAQRMEMIVSKTMRRVVPGLVLAAVGASTAAIVSKAEAAGDAAAGEHVFARCIVCHSPKAGENKIGPSAYSDARADPRRATTIHPPSNQLSHQSPC
jgi:mono/diheme cytochrome c family protein